MDTGLMSTWDQKMQQQNAHQGFINYNYGLQQNYSESYDAYVGRNGELIARHQNSEMNQQKLLALLNMPPVKPKINPKLEIETKPKQETNMISEVSKDMKAFIKEHKSAIYWVAILMLCDHFFFHGAFKEKLREMMNKMIGKVEDKIQKIEA